MQIRSNHFIIRDWSRVHIHIHLNAIYYIIIIIVVFFSLSSFSNIVAQAYSGGRRRPESVATRSLLANVNSPNASPDQLHSAGNDKLSEFFSLSFVKLPQGKE